jgi:hypothetical protein
VRADQPSRPWGQDQDEHADREQAEAGVQGRQAADVLQVLRREEQEGTEPAEREQRHDDRAAERDAAEEAQFEQRIGAARLVAEDAQDAEPGEDQQPEEHRRRPAEPARLDDRLHHATEHEDHEHLPEGVEPARPGRAGLGHERGGGHDGDGDDRHVDPEDGPPAEAVDEGAAEDRPERERQAGHRAEHADGAGAFGRRGEGRDDDGQGDRVEHGAADRLDGAGGDQPADAGRHAAQKRPEPENGEPGEEDALAPEPVRGGPGEHEEPGQHQRVGVDCPL